jgi:hypothetical protein
MNIVKCMNRETWTLNADNICTVTLLALIHAYTHIISNTNL